MGTSFWFEGSCEGGYEMASLYLVVDAEAYETYAKTAKVQYGKLFDLEKPETFPCIIYEDFWPGDCGPDSLLVLAIEKKHFDGPPYWNEFDIVYRQGGMV